MNHFQSSREVSFAQVSVLKRSSNHSGPNERQTCSDPGGVELPVPMLLAGGVLPALCGGSQDGNVATAVCCAVIPYVFAGGCF